MAKLKLKKCKKCGYEWTPIKLNPVACPRCKSRLDTPFANGKTVAM